MKFLENDAVKFVDKVLSHYKVTFEELTSTRQRPNPQIKQVICYFLIKKMNCTYTSVGRFFNNNHATIIHSVKQAQTIVEFEKDPYRHLYETIEKIYKNHLSPDYFDICFELSHRRYNYANR